MMQGLTQRLRGARDWLPDRYFLAPWDSRNPLRMFRIPVSRRIKRLSDELVAGTSGDHAKILRLMAYLSPFRVTLAGGVTPDAVIEERAGGCTTFATTLLAMAAAQGLPGRYVNFHNFPEGDGHTVGEIFIDGDWRLYDPSFGVYYIDGAGPDVLPMSYARLEEAYRRFPDRVTRIMGVQRPGLDLYTGPDIFVNASPAGPIGPDRPMFFPLSLGLVGQSILETKDFGAGFQGAGWIGAASTNQNQSWRLKGLTPGKNYLFVATPKGLGGLVTLIERSFLLSYRIIGEGTCAVGQHRFWFVGKSPQPLAISFTAKADNVVVELMHPYRGPEKRYLSMARYELRSAD